MERRKERTSQRGRKKKARGRKSKAPGEEDGWKEDCKNQEEEVSGHMYVRKTLSSALQLFRTLFVSVLPFTV